MNHHAQMTKILSQHTHLQLLKQLIDFNFVTKTLIERNLIFTKKSLMTLFESIVNMISGKKEDQHQHPDGYCPNCWGSQQYAGKFLEKTIEERIDTNNLNEKKGWIQEYAVTHFEGIKMQETTKDKFDCPACKLSIK